MTNSMTADSYLLLEALHAKLEAQREMRKARVVELRDRHDRLMIEGTRNAQKIALGRYYEALRVLREFEEMMGC